MYTRCLTGSLLCSEHRTITGATCIFVGPQTRLVYLLDYRYDMYICRTPTVFTGVTCISVGLQVRHVYLSDYRIDIYICQFSNNIIVHSSTHIFIELLNITWTILIRSNIYTVRLLLKIFLLQSLLMEVSEDIVMSDDNFLRNIHIYLNTSSADLWMIF